MKAISTAGVLIIRNNKVLLVKHGEKANHPNGTYGLPAGSIEEGETEKQAAIRELKEETGLIAAEEALLDYPQDIPVAHLKRKNGETKDFKIKVFLCKNYSGNLKKSEETEPEWVSIKDLDTYDLIGYTKRMIEQGLEEINILSS